MENKRIEASQEGDLISRQAAIDRIRGTGYADQIKENVIMILMGLPSVWPESCEDAVKSHSEKDILNMCISLLDEMVGYFGRYMEWIGYEPNEEEKECGYFRMTYFHIVQKLFLYHTTHSGGCSTFRKCYELGIDDPSDGVRFSLWEDEDDE